MQPLSSISKKRNRNNTSSRDTAERHKSIYVESNEYSELCKCCNLSATTEYCVYKILFVQTIFWQGDWQLVALRLFLYFHLFEF